MLVKKVGIACAYPIISIFMLRPGGINLLASYYQICGHVVILPQKLGFLFDLLPSNVFLLHKIIGVI